MIHIPMTVYEHRRCGLPVAVRLSDIPMVKGGFLLSRQWAFIDSRFVTFPAPFGGPTHRKCPHCGLVWSPGYRNLRLSEPIKRK